MPKLYSSQHLSAETLFRAVPHNLIRDWHVILHASFMLPTIAESGIAGKTAHSRLIMISVDKSQGCARTLFSKRFATKCHIRCVEEKLPTNTPKLCLMGWFGGLAVARERGAWSNGRTNNFLEIQKTASQAESDKIIAALQAIWRQDLRLYKYFHRRWYFAALGGVLKQVLLCWQYLSN